MSLFDNPILSITVLLASQPLVLIVILIAAALYVVPAILRRMRKGWN